MGTIGMLTVIMNHAYYVFGKDYCNIHLMESFYGSQIAKYNTL